MLYEKILNDLVQAQKKGEAGKVSVLRLALASLKNLEIEKRGKGKEPTLNEEEVITVLQKEAKKRKDAIELYRKGNREDLARKEETEAEVLDGYLPKFLSREEIEAVIDSLKSQGFSDFNSLMREAMKELRGKADGRLVSEIIKSKTQ